MLKSGMPPRVAGNRLSSFIVLVNSYQDELRLSKKEYDSQRAKMYGPQDLWHHVDCFVDKRDELGFGTELDPSEWVTSWKFHMSGCALTNHFARCERNCMWWKLMPQSWHFGKRPVYRIHHNARETFSHGCKMAQNYWVIRCTFPKKGSTLKNGSL